VSENKYYEHDVNNLVENPAWKEVVDTLQETRRGLIDDLCELDPLTEGGKIARQQGRLKMLEFVLALPDSFIEELREEAAKSKQESKEEESKDG
jgi:hypothetical protein